MEKKVYSFKIIKHLLYARCVASTKNIGKNNISYLKKVTT